MHYRIKGDKHIKNLKEKGMQVPEHIYNALLDRTREIGATDMF